MAKPSRVNPEELLRGERRIEYVALEAVVPATRNPKAHAEPDLDASVGRFGYTEPVLMDERTGRLVAGHGRVSALQRLKAKGARPPEGILEKDGSWAVPVVRGWASRSDQEAEAYLLASNQLTVAGGWNTGELIELLRELDAAKALEGVGFGKDELSALLDSVLPPGDAAADDEVPPVPEESWVVLGDFFELGAHRLLCGDSSNPDAVKRLLGNEKVDCVFTDPPYGIAYKAMRPGMEAIANDESPTDARRILVDALSLVPGVETYFVCCDWRSLGTIVDSLEEVGVAAKACIVWDKERGVQNLDRYFKQHEFIVYAGPYGGQPTVAGDVWRFPRDFAPDHPTPKPVELVAQALKTGTLAGALVFEPFSGSGSTLMACEQVGRRARAIELEPRYVQVALERWEKATGRKAVKVE